MPSSNEKYKVITKYTGSRSHMNIPTTVDGIKVFDINYGAFSNNQNLIDVYGATVKSIDTYAFVSCNNLKSVLFPNCSYIGMSAFRYCCSLTAVNFPNCSYIGNNAFECCYSLATVSFPKCEYIGGSAFWSCSSLTSVLAPNCNYIGSYAFLLCTALISVNLPNCSHIGIQTFDWCTALTSVNFPNCSYIGSSAFYCCGSLTSISFPNCSYIGALAFTGNKLSNWDGIVNSYFRLEQGCLIENSTNRLINFAKRSSHVNINTTNITYIESGAFYNCNSLTTVSFLNCSYIGSEAFLYCYSLAKVYFLSTAYVSGNSNMFYRCDKLTSIYVPMSMVSTYKTMQNWSTYQSKIVGYIEPEYIVGDKPVSSVNKSYTGSEITNGYTKPEHVTMTGTDRGTIAGQYIATYTPETDYYWSDFTTDTVTVTLTIREPWDTRPLTAAEFDIEPITWEVI